MKPDLSTKIVVGIPLNFSALYKSIFLSKKLDKRDAPLFFKKSNFKLKDFISEKTNRIFKLKRLIKTKKINKNLRFI